jgi:hypothetical protein
MDDEQSVEVATVRAQRAGGATDRSDGHHSPRRSAPAAASGSTASESGADDTDRLELDNIDITDDRG